MIEEFEKKYALSRVNKDIGGSLKKTEPKPAKK
jgi:hypothetical protein